MNKLFKIGLALILSVITVVLIVFWYPKYQVLMTEKSKLALENKISELSHLITVDHDCLKVVVQAKAFLTTHNNAEQIWSFLGSCQFDLGKLDEAKTSFNRVLSLNPENIPAKNYLEGMDLKPGQILITGPGLTLDRAQFQSTIDMGFVLGGQNLQFISADKRTSDRSEHFSATYTSRQTFSQTVSFFKQELKKAKTKFIAQDVSSATVFIINREKGENSFTIINEKPVKIIIKYVKINEQIK